MRSITLAFLLFAGVAAADQAGSQTPWRVDVAAARQESLKAGKPIVLIVNVDSNAL